MALQFEADSKTNVRDFFQRYDKIQTAEAETFKAVCVTPRICRFCGRGEADVTFNEQTHLIPDLLGKNKMLHYEECDSCNEYFGVLENDLSIYVRPYITITQTETKNCIPAFQSRSINYERGGNTIVTANDVGGIEILHTVADDVHFEEGRNFLNLSFRRPGFVPINAWSSLVKIGLALMPKEDIVRYKEVFRVISGRSDKPVHFTAIYMQTPLYGKKFRNPSAELYKAKSIYQNGRLYIEYTVIVCFANIVLQVFLPMPEDILELQTDIDKITLCYFPALFIGYEFGRPLSDVFCGEFSSDKKVKMDEQIELGFENRYPSPNSILRSSIINKRIYRLK